VFWRVDANPFVVGMRAELVADKRVAAEPFDLDIFDCTKTVMQTPKGIEYILLRRFGMTVQLASRGESLLHGSVAASFEIEGLSRMKFVSAALEKLKRMKQPERSMECSNWPNFVLHSRDYLIALDRDLNGANYRQIAQVIFGSERVKDEWTGETRFLKDRVRRAVERGHEIMNGGYRDLLRKR
jgi:hypothetical protein